MTALGLDPHQQPPPRHHAASSLSVASAHGAAGSQGASSSSAASTSQPAHGTSPGASSSRAHRTLRVYSFVGLVMLAAGAAMLEPGLPARQSPQQETVRWVRTRNGWEKAVWLRPSAVYQPRLHPLVVGVGLSLASVLALLCFPVVPQDAPRTRAARDVPPRA